jgi:uncharacterized protein YjbI with pentapeptide repeats
MVGNLIPSAPEFGQLNEGRRFRSIAFTDLKDSPESPYSFVRCDFIQATFLSCRFQGADFSNSDFTGVIFRDTALTSCNLMSTAYSSCLFSRCRFTNNRNFNCDLIDCAVDDSEFTSQLIDRSVWRNVTIARCAINEVTLRRSTWDEVTLRDVRIRRINFMDNYCVHCVFLNCQFEDADFDASYFGSNIFRGCALSGLSLRYKDEYILVDADDPRALEQLADHYHRGNQFAEAFNMGRYIDTIRSDASAAYPLASFAECLKNVLGLNPENLATQQLRFLFQVVNVDYEQNLIDPLYVFQLDAICESALASLRPSSLRDELLRSASTIRDVAARLLDKGGSVPAGTIAELSLTFDEIEAETAQQFTRQLLDPIIGSENYQIVGTRTGSIIVEVVTYAGAAVIVAATIRVVTGQAISTYIDFLSAEASRRALANVDSLKGLRDVTEIQLMRNRITAGAAALSAKQIEALRRLDVKL